MRIYECKDYHSISRTAANFIAAQVTMKPDCVLGLATGSTPIGIYDRLAEEYLKKEISFRQVRSINLDEYQGLRPDHPQSYRAFMEQQLFHRVDFLSENTHLPNGMTDDPKAECSRYDALIDSLGGIDIQLLGLGRNGHIGFNEPADAFTPDTHLADLTESTINANKRFFPSAADVPRQALTVGMKAIMQAKKILMVVSGADKTEAVAKAFCGMVTPRLPASILQIHPDVVLIGDAVALSGLKRGDVVRL